MKKEYLVKLAEEACNQLESNDESHFFKILEHVLLQNIPLSKMIPFAEIVGKRGLNNPGFYFGIIDKLINKDLDYGYRAGFYDIQKKKTNEEEFRKFRVYGYRAGIVGAIFNEMSRVDHEKVVNRTKQYIIAHDNLYSSNKFAERVFNNIFMEKFSWIKGVLKEWAKDENKWIRAAAGFALHTAVEKKILNKNQFVETLEILDQLMQDNSKEVKNKVGRTLRSATKYFPDETYGFLRKWSGKENKDTVLIIKKALKFLDDDRKDELQKLLNDHK